MIDYMKQLNAFNERCLITGMSPRVRVVYYTLLDMNNRLFWAPSFRTTIRIIADRSGLNKNGVDLALQTLKNEGLIEYVPSNKKGTGSLIKICPLLGTQTGTDNNLRTSVCPEIGTEIGTNVGTNIGTGTGTQTGTTIKQKENKRKENNISVRAKKKFVPPTLEEVSQYVTENKLRVSAKDFFDYFTAGDWIDSKGQKVLSWKQKLRTWEKYQSEVQNGRRSIYRGSNTKSPEYERSKWENEPNGWRTDLAI